MADEELLMRDFRPQKKMKKRKELNALINNGGSTRLRASDDLSSDSEYRVPADRQWRRRRRCWASCVQTGQCCLLLATICFSSTALYMAFNSLDPASSIKSPAKDSEGLRNDMIELKQSFVDVLTAMTQINETQQLLMKQISGTQQRLIGDIVTLQEKVTPRPPHSLLFGQCSDLTCANVTSEFTELKKQTKELSDTILIQSKKMLALDTAVEAINVQLSPTITPAQPTTATTTTSVPPLRSSTKTKKRSTITTDSEGKTSSPLQAQRLAAARDESSRLSFASADPSQPAVSPHKSPKSAGPVKTLQPAAAPVKSPQPTAAPLKSPLSTTAPLKSPLSTTAPDSDLLQQEAESILDFKETEETSD